MTVKRRRVRRLIRAAAGLALPAGLAAGAAACSADHSAVLATVRDSAGVTIVENAPGADEAVPRWTVTAEPELRIGALEGEPAYMFHNPWTAATLGDGRTAVVDYGSRQVRVFAPDGRVLAVQGGDGAGPGEYRSPDALWVLPGDSLAVFDPALSRVTILATTGDSVVVGRMATLLAGAVMRQPVGAVDGGRRVVLLEIETDPNGPIKPQFTDVWTAPIEDGAAADSLLRVIHGRLGRIPGGDPRRSIGRPLFDPWGRVIAGADRIVYGPGDAAALHVHDGDGRLRRIVRWDAGDRSADPDLATRWIDSALARMPERARPSQRRYYESLPLADSLPAHDQVLLDTTGRVWVARWSPWDHERGREWWVFEPDGRMVATAEIPTGVRVLEIGEDHVVGVVQDEAGVEYVARLAVRAPRDRN